MFKHKLVDFIIHFMEEIDKEINDMKIALNSRARLSAEEFLKRFWCCALYNGRWWIILLLYVFLITSLQQCLSGARKGSLRSSPYTISVYYCYGVTLWETSTHGKVYSVQHFMRSCIQWHMKGRFWFPPLHYNIQIYNPILITHKTGHFLSLQAYIYSTERDIPWLITPRDIIFNPLDISSRT